MISLGQGQGPKATAAITKNVTEGGWIVLQNCHLATSYMGELESIVEEFDPEKVHEAFRLCLTTMPNDTFPVSILQKGIKMTLEPPEGFKVNILKKMIVFVDDINMPMKEKCGAQ